jgi:hypothetical protein
MFLDDAQHRFQIEGISRMTIQSRAILVVTLLLPMGPAIAHNKVSVIEVTNTGYPQVVATGVIHRMVTK